MGKKLIIKGADFSANCIPAPAPVVYSKMLGITDSLYNQMTLISSTEISGTPAMFCDKLTVFTTHNVNNKAILGIRLKVSTSGLLPISKAYFSSDSDAGSSFTLLKTFTISAGMIDHIVDLMFDTPVQLGNNEKIVFGNPNSSMTSTFYIGLSTISDVTLYRRVNATSWTTGSTPFGVDYLLEE